MTDMIIKCSFWIFIAFLFYIYIGYPLILYFINKLVKSKFDYSTVEYIPVISLIIPARNEEKIIEKKIRNCLELDYPENKLEIVIVSDNSTDKTDEIVRKFSKKNVKLISLQERHGKTEAQNMASKLASGEILVFSDANAMYIPEALKHLASHFINPEVACVSGELCYKNPNKSIVGHEENFYWQYEKFIKKQEDQIGTILGVNGSIYAIRKAKYIPLEKDMISDLIEPLEIVYRGGKIIYESRAISYEEASISFEDELNRKRRIVSRSIYSLLKHPWLLNPFKNPMMVFELISHKILRWLSPIFMIFILIINLFILKQVFYISIFYIQMLFYLLSILGCVLRGNKALPSFFFIPYYVYILGYSSILGIVDVIHKKDFMTWEPIRH